MKGIYRRIDKERHGGSEALEQPTCDSSKEDCTYQKPGFAVLFSCTADLEHFEESAWLLLVVIH
jgi:hypothetical protein